MVVGVVVVVVAAAGVAAGVPLRGVVVIVIQSLDPFGAEVFQLRLMAETAAECGVQNPLRICSAHDCVAIGFRG